MSKSKANMKMKWKAAPVELCRVFEDTMRRFPRVQLRKMFGYPAAFVNGNMVAGLFQDRMMLRLAKEDRTAIPAKRAQNPSSQGQAR